MINNTKLIVYGIRLLLADPNSKDRCFCILLNKKKLQISTNERLECLKLWQINLLNIYAKYLELRLSCCYILLQF